MLYMRGSSTDDSFIRNRLTYKRAKRWERTGRKSQYFTLISWHSDMSLCVSVCFVIPTARTSALCIIMDPVPTGELAVDCLWMLLQLPLPLSLSFPRFLFTLPGMFGRKAPSSPVRARFSVTAETWLWWAEGDAHTKHTCITYSQRTLSILAF